MASSAADHGCGRYPRPTLDLCNRTGIGAASYGEPAHHHRGQERGLSEGCHRDEEGWRALAPITAAAGEILEQHRRARSPAGETINRPGTWLWWLLDGPTNAGRLRGDGDDQERAGSEHQRRRHQGPGSLHRWTVPGGRLS